MTEDDPELASLRALAHPLRLQTLSLLTGTAMSAAELARELDVSHANASYHLRLLADAGLVVEAGEEKIRGGVARRYRHPWDRSQQSTAGSTDATAAESTGAESTGASRIAEVQSMSIELVRRFSGRHDQSHTLLADAELWVTPETWDRVWTLLREAAVLLHAEAQPPRSPGIHHVNLTAAAFRMADLSPATARGAEPA